MSLPWEHFLREQFPAYLLPHAARAAIEPEAARLFLQRFVRRTDVLALISAASLLIDRAEQLHDFTFRLLPSLIRQLPATSEIEPRVWEGGFHGALDIPRTLALHRSGRPTHFATRQRRRSFELPENILVASVARRLFGCMEALERAGALSRSVGSWGERSLDTLGRLRHLLLKSRLSAIVPEPIANEHLRAARAARHPAFAEALQWHQALDQVVERPIPEVVAQQLAAGALLPMRVPKQFEIAVLLRLLQSLENELHLAAPGHWVLEREVVLQGRRGPVARLQRRDQTRIDVYYDQAPKQPGRRDRALRHYLHHGGRLRPDILFAVHHPDGRRRAAVIEVKCSVKPNTLIAGLTEAMVYQEELAPSYPGGVVAIAVGVGGVMEKPRAKDSLILTDWEQMAGLSMAQHLLTEGP